LHHIISPIVDEYDELHHILVYGSESKLFLDFISSFIVHNLYTSESSISPHILSFPWLSQTLRSSVASSRGLLLCGSLGGDLCWGAKKIASEDVEKCP
jgi:hypothetical protein